VFLDETPIVTLAVGCELSLMLKSAKPPPSLVVKPLVGVTMMPTVSLSTLTAETSAALTPL